MDPLVVYLLAFMWGGMWAGFLQFTKPGRFLAQRRTWITVVVGVGVDVLLMLLLGPTIHVWPEVLGVLGASCVLIIVRSLVNEYRDSEQMLRAAGGATEDDDGEAEADE
jgi:hypothetical protein